jgi:hypothetical protein
MVESGLSIYLDECVSNTVIPLLSAWEHTVITAQSQGTNTDPDDAQIRYATVRGWVVLTTNRKHYYQEHHDFRQRGEHHSGIITVPQDDWVPERFLIRCAMMAAWVATAFSTPDNTLFRWSDFQAMLHRGHQPEGFTAAEIALALGIHTPTQIL